MATKDLDRFPRGPALAGVGALIAVGLGVWGLRLEELGWTDAAYRTLQLFVLGADIPDQPNSQLEVARYLALIGLV